MGRDVAGLRFEKKPNVVNLKPNGENIEIKDSEPDDHSVVKGRLIDERNKKQQDSVKQVKSTNNEPPEEKVIRVEAQKSTTDKKSNSAASGSAVNANTIDANSLEPENQEPCDPANADDETNDSPVKKLPQSKKSQHFQNKKYYDDEDNCSLASSSATYRTNKFKVTVPVGPKFTCGDRLERRKEFYSKLEEKHKALEKEKLEHEARIREEEQEAIKQLRKSMVYKANPVPSFYREGPPPKVELKKLPLTRAKSPKLTRRKSCGDAIRTSREDKEIQGQAITRRSVSINREDNKNAPITPKGKDRIGSRKFNEHSKGKNQATNDDDDDDLRVDE